MLVKRCHSVFKDEREILQIISTLVSNHFHSVKSFLFSSTRPCDFDGMLDTGLPVSVYTMKTPIDMWHFKIPQLKEFLTFSVKVYFEQNI